MPDVANTVWFTAGSSATANFSDGTALTGSRNMAGGATSGKTYTYRAEHPSDKSIWENGSGLWNGTTLVRTVAQSSTGSVINFAVAPIVLLAPMKRDWDTLVQSDIVQALTAAQQAQARANVYAAPFDALAFNGMQINGSMEVSQEIGTTLTAVPNNTSPYALDGWHLSSNGSQRVSTQQVADAPAGLTNSLKVTVTTPDASLSASEGTVIIQKIEGYRTSRLAFGSASAQSVSIGFWTKIFRTGAYSGSIQNSVATRSYPFSFTQNVSNTWEFKTVTIPGDTTGTWVGNTNDVGLTAIFCIGWGSANVGTANAWAASNLHGVTGTTNGVASTSDIFQISGLIVLPGIELPSSDRLPLIMRPFPEELARCKRYWEKSDGLSRILYQGQVSSGSSYVSFPSFFGTVKRVAPTIVLTNAFNGGFDATPGSVTVDVSGLSESRACTGTGNSNYFSSTWTASSRL